jgi:hypothetical protein
MSMIPKKIDQQTASTIKDSDHSIDDLLEAAGALSPERA